MRAGSTGPKEHPLVKEERKLLAEIAKHSDSDADFNELEFILSAPGESALEEALLESWSESKRQQYRDMRARFHPRQQKKIGADPFSLHPLMNPAVKIPTEADYQASVVAFTREYREYQAAARFDPDLQHDIFNPPDRFWPSYEAYAAHRETEKQAARVRLKRAAGS
jgi:hypothetical protein